MAERKRRDTASGGGDRFPEEQLLENPLYDEQSARIRLRQRWELASVLNFLIVFRSVVPKDLKISAEDVETALITANEDLRRIHIALLKGIPPVSKNITDPDAWITSVCKKLATWWSWVADGEIPLKADHGKEIQSYKQLDPTARLLILKALCDVRSEQDDVLGFIAGELKKGTEVSTFRKERVSACVNGVTYWYDGDPVVGHRLYREIDRIYCKHKAKGKDSTAEPTVDSQWETVATNIEEFRGVVESLTSSNVPGETILGETIKTKILPVLEHLEKKKEKALQRKERHALHLASCLDSRIGSTRTCRERMPVRYTFDEYDRSIDEAIQLIMEPNNAAERTKEIGKQHEGRSGYHSANGNMETLDEHSGGEEDSDVSDFKKDAEKWDEVSNHDDEDDDYDVHDDDDDDDDKAVDDGDDAIDSEKDEATPVSEPTRKKKHLNGEAVAGLRRSRRNADVSERSDYDGAYDGAYLAVMKKRLRQRPTRNAGYTEVISDSEDENPAEKFRRKADDSSSTHGSSNTDSGDESPAET